MPDTGQLASKPAPEIFREMAATARSGVLRIAQDRKVRVVVFEQGRPVFAISNVPEDQLDMILLRQRRITRDQAAAVRREVQKEPEIGPKLVELGLVDEATLEATRLEQIERVVQNAMMTREGEYMLDHAARVAHDISIDPNVDQWLLDTARNVSADAARALLGEDELYVAAHRDGLELSPLDSFLLGRVTRPMSVDEIRRAGQFSVDEGLPVIYALYASGLLVRATARSATAGDIETGKSSAELRVELDRMLASYRDFDYYDILQIARHADSSEVKRAYYLLAKQYHPDRHRNEADPEVLEKLEAVFAEIGRAYDTLKDDRLRVDYDRRLGAGTAKIPPPATPSAPPRSVSSSATAPPPRRATPSVEPHATPRPTATPPAHSTTPAHSVHATATPIAHSGPSEPSLTTHQLAERSFQEGLQAYQNRDVLRAIHLFRDAVRQAPEKGTYHLHLGVALTSNPRWYKEAEKHLLEAARTDPMNLQVFLKLGMIYQEGGLRRRAEAQYRQALGIDPYNRIARKALIDMGFEAPPLRGGSGAKESSTGGLLSKLFKKK